MDLLAINTDALNIDQKPQGGNEEFDIENPLTRLTVSLCYYKRRPPFQFSLVTYDADRANQLIQRFTEFKKLNEYKQDNNHHENV
jgi:hypothetical protein